MIPIASARELATLSTLPRAIVFIYVNWSVQARQSDVAIRELLAAWQVDQASLALPAFRIDLTDQSGEIWEATRAWLRDERQPYDMLTYSGGGAIVWLRSGRVVATMPDAYRGRDQLRATTMSLFADEPGAGSGPPRARWLNDVHDAWCVRPSLAARWFLMVLVFFLLSMIVLALSRPWPSKAAAAAFLLAIVAGATELAICRGGHAVRQIRSIIFFNCLWLLGITAGAILLAFF